MNEISSSQIRNPFTHPHVFDIELSLDSCRQIRFEALQRSLATDQNLWSDVKRRGMSILIPHPVDAREMFVGVTTSVYRLVIQLYCDHLGRSIDMVHQILNKMALESKHSPISFDAVWAICQHAWQRRTNVMAVSISPQSTRWYFGRYQLNFTLVNDKQQLIPHPQIAYIAQTAPPRILAFRLIPDDETPSEINNQLLYDALVAQRKPTQYSPGGLNWLIPVQLAHWSEDSSSMDVFSIADELISEEGVQSIREVFAGWDRDLAGQTLSVYHASLIFDQFLKLTFDYAPRQRQLIQEQSFSQSVSYNRDPAWQLPALKKLLPSHQSTIEQGGVVQFDNLHYENSLLYYWTGHSVTLRQSAWAESVAWIYLDNQILCEAYARELRRADDTYRPWRTQ